MPVTVKFDPASQTPQAQVIGDATCFQDGVLSATLACKLINLQPGGGGGTVFVFRPGGVAGGNVFTDWALLMAAVSAAQGARVIEFDDLRDTVPCVIPPGTWNMTDVSWIGTDQTPRTDVEIGEGVLLPGLRSIVGNLDVTFSGATPPVSDFSEFDTFFVREGATLICSGTGPFVRVTTAISVVVVVGEVGFLQTDASPVVDLAVPGAAVFLIAFALGEVQHFTLSGVVGSFYVPIIMASSGRISETQPAFLGTFVPLNLTHARMDPTPVVDITTMPSPVEIDPNFLVRCDPTGGIALKLPTAFDTRGQWVIVKNITASIDPITIFAAPGDTIDGAASVVLSGNRVVMRFISDGASEWMVV